MICRPALCFVAFQGWILCNDFVLSCRTNFAKTEAKSSYKLRVLCIYALLAGAQMHIERRKDVSCLFCR